jgi:hypothetical protein
MPCPVVEGRGGDRAGGNVGDDGGVEGQPLTGQQAPRSSRRHTAALTVRASQSASRRRSRLGPQLVQQLLRPGAGPAVRLLERRAPVRSAGHVPLSSPPCRPGLTHRHVTRTRRAPAPGTAPPAAGGDGPPAEMPRPGPGGGLGRLTGRMPRKPGSTPPLHEAVRRGRPPPRRRAPRAGRCRATGRRRSRAARLSALCCLRSGRPCSVGRETGALTLPGFMRRAAWAPSRRAWTRRRPAMHARRPLTA